MNKIAVISNFLAFFCFYLKNFPSWIRIRILNADPDPGGKMNADPSGSGSTALLFHYYVQLSFNLTFELLFIDNIWVFFIRPLFYKVNSFFACPYFLKLIKIVHHSILSWLKFFVNFRHFALLHAVNKFLVLVGANFFETSFWIGMHSEVNHFVIKDKTS